MRERFVECDRELPNGGKLLETRALPVTFDLQTMITGIGIDVIQNDRIRDSIEKFADRFVNRIYTESEREYCKEFCKSGSALRRAMGGKRSRFQSAGNRLVGRRQMEGR